jgi:hypothetical protein
MATIYFKNIKKISEYINLVTQSMILSMHQPVTDCFEATVNRKTFQRGLFSGN